MIVTGFWNNKGGTGKTSLAFQAVCQFAQDNPNKRVLVIDVCPQANLSELLLGGLEGEGGKNLLEAQGKIPRCSVGGYFQLRLPRPYDAGTFQVTDFVTQPNKRNPQVPSNVDLVPGDPLLELQANAMSTLANNQIPGTDTWTRIVSWLRDFIGSADGKYDYVFVDMNPSFSIYTQVALAACDRLVLPVMADDSSRRAIQNAFSLIYGLKLPSEIYAQHMFSTKLMAGGLLLPKVHLIVKNRITQYMGPASGYAAVLESIDKDLLDIVSQVPDHFTFNDLSNGVVEVRDFQSTGVVAFARGTPFFALRPGKLGIGDKRIAIDRIQRDERAGEMRQISQRLL